MTKNDSTTALGRPTPVGQPASDNSRTYSSSTSTTPPPAKAARMIGDLKIVHESPEEAPVQRERERERRNASPLSREELLEQATKFLESSPIKNAPLKEKLEFLHTKGLTKAEMEVLLARLEEKAIGAAPTAEEKGKGKQAESSPPPPSTAVVRESPTPSSTPSSKEAEAAPPKPPPAQQAPIVTYPEFLTPAPLPPPPPLLTAKSLGKALYFATGAAATIYGANKFVFTPMYDALTAARLDLSSTALTNLNELNNRLRELVPEGGVVKSRPIRDDESDTSSTSDPGEMFHIDAQTQTSPSLDSFPLEGDEVDVSALSPDGKLEHLSTQLESLVKIHGDSTDNELTFALEDLTSYLETLTYDYPGMGMFSGPYGGYGPGNKDKDKDDPIAKVKTEIRSIKGVLLNIKNFPASR